MIYVIKIVSVQLEFQSRVTESSKCDFVLLISVTSLPDSVPASYL